MKKMMLLACLIMSATAITAAAVTVDEIKGTENSAMVSELANLNPSGWTEYLNTAFESGDDALIMKVVMNAQKALDSLDAKAAQDVANELNDNVKDISVARQLAGGKYTLAYVGSVNSVGQGVNLKSLIDTGDGFGYGDGIMSIIDSEAFNLKTSQIGKGVGTVSASSSKY